VLMVVLLMNTILPLTVKRIGDAVIQARMSSRVPDSAPTPSRGQVLGVTH